jgi:hypothetical protein
VDKNITYGYASLQLLVPEDRTEPEITPWQIFAHTHGFNGTSQAVRNYFAKLKVLVEAHMSFPLIGTPIQMQYLDRQADAQGRANGFRLPSQPGKLLGAISCEAEDRGDPKLPYSREQVEDQGLFWAFCSMKFPWIPLELINDPDAPGISYHSRFKINNPNAHACPSPVRIEQLPDVINVAKWFRAMASNKSTDIVATVKTNVGEWKVQRDGGVLTVKGPFLGSYPGLAPVHRAGNPGRQFKTAVGRSDGGYTLVSEADEKYDFPYPPRRP